jgi:hypothetical protein
MHGYFLLRDVPEHTRKFCLRRMQVGTALRNTSSWHRYKQHLPSSTEFWVSLCIQEPFLKKNITESMGWQSDVTDHFESDKCCSILR